MSKVLITGATGFIGNHVTRLCLEQGHDVRVMVMKGEDRSPPVSYTHLTLPTKCRKC